MGTKDTPAVIDFILKTTKYDQLNYIGHSEGTTQIMAGASLMPDFYRSKMKLAFFLAPPACMRNNPQFLLKFMSTEFNQNLILGTLKIIKLWNILPYNFATTGSATLFCSLFDGKMCSAIMSLFADVDPTIDYTERYDVYMSNLPAGASVYNFFHYGQNIHLKENGFQRWDYGNDNANIKAYNQKTPP
jgi:pimeloyl-ACP methyl ester carboxylesterase